MSRRNVQGARWQHERRDRWQPSKTGFHQAPTVTETKRQLQYLTDVKLHPQTQFGIFILQLGNPKETSAFQITQIYQSFPSQNRPTRYRRVLDRSNTSKPRRYGF